jgi:hypothetical protein
VGTGAADESADTGLDFAIDSDASAASASDNSVPGRIGGDDSDLDFDLGSLDEAQQSAEAGIGDDLDFSLDDGSDSTGGLDDSTAGGESSLDFDLGDTTSFSDGGGATDPLQDAAESDDGLDLQLDVPGDGDSTVTADAGDESVLDFDLGDTAGTQVRSSDSDLDFDLGDTAGTLSADADQLVEEATSDGGEIDFDLGETAKSLSPIGEDDSTVAGGESALDFDLGDTGAAEVADSGSTDDDEPGLDLDLGSMSDDDEPLSLDMGSDESGDSAGAEVFQDARTEIGDESELDLVLDMGNDGGGDELPVLDMGENGGAEGDSIDTVQLSPDAMDSLRPI